MMWLKRAFAWNADRYKCISAPLERWKWGRAVLKWSNLLCALIFYTAYPLLLFALFYRQDPFLRRALVVPAVFFLLLSFFRKWINRPRPYEALAIVPLLKRESFGASFPSRHIFSAFMIAGTISVITPWGYLLYLSAILLAFIRVIGGVHYPSDVIAGAGIALLASLLYYV